MPHALLSLGTNTHHGPNMALAMLHLARTVTIMGSTGCMWTKAVGQGHGIYLNCMVSIDTCLSASELISQLKRIEAICGRNANRSARGIIDIDIDLMEYSGQRIRPDDWAKPYIKQLNEQLCTNRHLRLP